MRCADRDGGRDVRWDAKGGVRRDVGRDVRGDAGGDVRRDVRGM